MKNKKPVASIAVTTIKMVPFRLVEVESEYEAGLRILSLEDNANRHALSISTNLIYNRQLSICVFFL